MSGKDFLASYRDLEESFRRQAEEDGDVLLPNFRPESHVNFILVAMEPSFSWAADIRDAHEQIQNGFRNFSYSLEDFVLHFSIRRFPTASLYSCGRHINAGQVGCRAGGYS